MPITLHPISRRRFLANSAAAVAGALLVDGIGLSAPADGADADHVVLFSDTHIAADRSAHERGVVMYDHLEQAVAEVRALRDKPPAMLLVNGDCAYHMGKTDDYVRFLELLKPLRESGLPIHLAMGNHDQREHFWSAAPPDQKRVKAIEDREVLVIETPRADWIMLDSLDKTNSTPGVLGAQQLDWLAGELDRRHGRKIIVMVHHNIDFREKVSGLIDSAKLLDVLLPRKQVKALLYGHTHEWRVTKREDLHCINLPAVAYVFQQGEPSGWVDAHLSDAGMTIELRCLDKNHPKNGERHELTWRAA